MHGFKSFSTGHKLSGLKQKPGFNHRLFELNWVLFSFFEKNLIEFMNLGGTIKFFTKMWELLILKSRLVGTFCSIFLGIGDGTHHDVLSIMLGVKRFHLLQALPGKVSKST